MSTNPPEVLKERIERLEILLAERHKLERELFTSLRLMELFPDAFKGGKCATTVERVRGEGRRYAFIITNGEGTRHATPLETVDSSLWRHLVTEEEYNKYIYPYVYRHRNKVKVEDTHK